jgi:hypothetical protein
MKYLYLAKKDGGIVVHADKQAMFDLDGIEEPDMTVTEEEFYAADGLVRIKDNIIVLGRKTAAEEAEEENRKRIAEIDAELDEIDRKSIRPGRAVSHALAKGKTAPAHDVSKLDEYEERADTLRKERDSLNTGVAGQQADGLK